MIIDISSNNGLVDFKQVKQAGVEKVVIRSTMGFNTHDKMLQTNANAASTAGIPVLYYHFAYLHSDRNLYLMLLYRLTTSWILSDSYLHMRTWLLTLNHLIAMAEIQHSHK